VNARSLRHLLVILSFASAPAALADPPTTASTAGEQRPVLLLQAGSGVVAAAVTAPLSIWAGQWLSTLTGSDLGALPALLLAVALPPVAVSLASWVAGNWAGPGRFHLSPAIWITTGVSVATFVAAGFLGFNANEPGRLAAYTAADMVLLPAAAVITMQWTAGEPQPHLPKMASMPVVRFQF
jgi:hypothetical protein